MSCMFRATGEEFDVKGFLQQFSITPYSHWVRGAERHSGKLYDFSGFSMVASSADMDAFDTQVTETIQFIRTHSEWLHAVTTFPGVEGATLDFGINLPSGAIPMISFPPEFVSAAGAHGLWLETSLYYSSDNDVSS